ncbi:MAG: hypothetical protein LBS24_00375 [Clostridiales Family XIII bacterium]|jgi:hypothetical protein|nr:hypothetical protein [Clostridiales Family XIII bacterium]
MKIKKTAPEIWAEYTKGQEYNTEIGLYDTVRENENFYIGKQWEGVNAPDLEKPTFNMLKRVISYFIAMLTSDDIAANITPFSDDPFDIGAATVVSSQIPEIFENADAKAKFRDMIKNGAVDGDAYLYVYFDPQKRTGQAQEGMIDMEVVDNLRVMYANPHGGDIQKQPYILVIMRRPVEEVRDEAAALGAKDGESIGEDDESLYMGEEKGDGGLVTVITKLWKEKGTVRAVKTTASVVLRKEFDTGLTLYPVAPFVWEKVRNSFHGMSAISGLIPNQIAVNKLFAMAIHSIKTTAFPKIIYNSTAMGGKKWNNRVGETIEITNSMPKDAIMQLTGTGDMSPQVMDTIAKIVDNSRDFMGASDSALGNVKPENTSAIIVAREATAIPLELQRMSFYHTAESLVRICIDMMRAYYGVREVSYKTPGNEEGRTLFDFSLIAEMAYKLNVEIGPSTYWSEVTQQQTIDNLFVNGVITDPILYLENIPTSQLPNKRTIIENLKMQRGAGLSGMPQGVPAGGGAAPSLPSPATAPQAALPPAGGESVSVERILAALSPEERAAAEENPSLLESVLAGLAS